MANRDPYAALVIGGGVLAIIGLVFVLLSMFVPESTSWTLPAALVSVGAGLIMNIVYRSKTPKA